MLDFQDVFYAFKEQLVTYADFLHNGKLPVPWEETEELMKIIIAAIRSRQDNNRKVYLDEIKVS